MLAALETPEFADLLRESAPHATAEQLGRVHPANYVEAILVDPSGRGRDGAAGRRHRDERRQCRGRATAAGAGVAGVDAVMEGWARAAFAAVRPPGHHAEPSRPMGFCLFNNAAVAALHARARWGVQRVAVVDFDVHHGNGTQAMFAADPICSTPRRTSIRAIPAPARVRAWHGAQHRQRAAAAGLGRRRIPRRVVRHHPAGARPLRPGLLIVSAGFDAHKADPLAQLRVETADYGWITQELLRLAAAHCGGRLVSVLEGGYDLEALAASAAAHVRTLMQA